VQQVIEEIGRSPYAVVVGLLLSGIPLYVPLARGAIRLVRFTLGSIQLGFKRQLWRTRRRNIRSARRLLDTDALIVYLAKELMLFLIQCFTFVVYLLSCLFLVTLRSLERKSSDEVVLTGSSLLLFTTLIGLVFFQAFSALYGSRVIIVTSLRRRLKLKRSRRDRIRQLNRITAMHQEPLSSSLAQPD
jgi:hypothetical protein